MAGIMRMLGAILLVGAASAAEKFTKEQLNARFYYDLGPAEADVSSYPQAQKDNYGVFARNCSQCHTLARPINAPIVSRKDWKRYVQRMHLKTKVSSGTAISKEDAKAIVDFLAYDSKVRKVDRKAGFAAKTAELQRLFEDVKKERGRLQAEEDRKKARELPMGESQQPRPR